MIAKVVITDALLSYDGEGEGEEKWRLHPALAAWEQQLLAMRQRWSVGSDVHTPLTWLAEKQGLDAATWLAMSLKEQPQTAQQYWIVTPYHGRLTRAEIRVMPECMVDWSASLAAQVCALINPLLLETGMALHHVAGALVLACDRVWDVQPEHFAAIAGKSLPNRSPAGEDAMLWMRLLTEIQMTLHQHPVQTAQGVDIHGLWFWQGGAAGAFAADDSFEGNMQRMPSVATRHVYLQAALQAWDKTQGASMVVTEAEELQYLLQAHMPMPKTWVLLAEGKEVVLQRNVWRACWSKLRPQTWQGKI